MNKAIALLLVSSLSIVAVPSIAAPMDDAPPAQKQKDQVPDSTKNGNYLESQPDNNGATDKTTKKKSNSDKTNNIEKSKKVKETPEAGGVNVN